MAFRMIQNILEEQIRILRSRRDLPEREIDLLLEAGYRKLSRLEHGGSAWGPSLARLLRPRLAEVEMTLLPERRRAFEVLGVAPETPIEEIKRSFRRLALEFHPDRNPSGEDRIRQLNRAWALVRRMRGVGA